MICRHDERFLRPTPRRPNLAGFVELACRAIARSWRARRFDDARPARDRVLLEALEPRILLSADVNASIPETIHSDRLLPSDSIHQEVTIANNGDEAAPAGIVIDMYASVDLSLGAGDRKLASFVTTEIIPAGESRTVAGDLALDDLTSGTYALIARADATNLLAEGNEDDNVFYTTTTFDVAWRFGQVPNHNGKIPLTVLDADGSYVTFTLSGNGRGEVTPTTTGFDLTLTDTDLASTVTIAVTGGDGRTTLHDISVIGSLNVLVAPTSDLSGNVAISGAIQSLTLGDIAAPHVITIGAAAIAGTSIAAGQVTDLVLTSASPINLLQVVRWDDTDAIPDMITAPSLQRLSVQQDFDADLHLTGNANVPLALANAQIGGAIGASHWNVQGRAGQISAGTTSPDWQASFTAPVSSIITTSTLRGQIATPSLGVLQAGGDLVTARIMIGANLGADGVLGGIGEDADVFTSGNLPRLRIAGSMIDSRIWVGIDPVDGILDNGNDRLAPGPDGQIREIAVGGLISQLSSIASKLLPVITLVDQQSVNSSQIPQLTTRPQDRVAPTITAALANDTGNSSSDRITADVTVSGQASDLGGVDRLLAALDPAAGGLLTDLSSVLAADGGFTLTRAQLDALAGGALADGDHTLRLQARDRAGNASSFFDLSFTLDTSAPVAPDFNLAFSSDSGILRDGITSAAMVTLVGAAEAGTQLTLAPANLQALAGAGGVFQFANVALADGENAFSLTATDAAGNVSLPAVQVFTREGVLAADAVSTWHSETLATVVRDAEDPPAVARTLAMESLAVLDVINAFEGTPSFAVKMTAPVGASLDAAIAGAAHRVLTSLYPAQRQALDERLTNALAAITDGQSKSDGLAFGQALADAVLATRANDGYKDFVDYPGSTALGAWRPTGPTFELAALPQWADVTPFVLNSASALRPAAPPALDSADYGRDVEEVRRLGSASSVDRTQDQTETVHFWADGPGTTTPGGHWNQIAGEIAQQQGLSAGAKARLFAQLNVALADAGVAAWDAKYFYSLWRPETAIANADLDANDATEFEANWRPRLITPNHPEYVSGHSTYSAVAAAVLESVFGESFAFDTTSPGLPGVTRHFASFEQAAQEAGRSRIYGGIHYEFTNQAGQQLGREVAGAVLARFALDEDTQGPAIALEAVPEVSNYNLTIRGQVVDNLAGVASLQVEIDPIDDFEGEGEPRCRRSCRSV
ncbi:MAG: phosphatase PAP2 family protein [Burkholderiales bacterium]|nr:phosphatase PAP2 family protein [Burkholderiales bacterium]